MGAEDFEHYVETEQSLEDTFNDLVEQALYDHGHAGYSGTIAEKPAVRLYPTTMTLDQAAQFIAGGSWWDNHDKWGEAEAIAVTEGSGGPRVGWYIFGYASS